ncbi:hypothetical protein [Sinomonas sp. P47F7]|uniref:hypothetical protein n=1 Tax=Sinomonas sp. P47F7 TaxID=3410987 RepID=UPI003BF515FD
MFDFELVDALLAQARGHDLRLVLLWFGSWKSGMSSYAPSRVKQNPSRFSHEPNSPREAASSTSHPSARPPPGAAARAFGALVVLLRRQTS